MFRFFQRREGPRALELPTTGLPTVAHHTPSMLDPAFPGALLRRLLARLEQSGGFLGACSDTPGFELLPSPEGLQNARAVLHQASVIIGPQVAAASFAGRSAARVAMTSLDPVLSAHFSARPGWQANDAGDMVLRLALPTGKALRLECRAASVDPLLTGREGPGALLILTVTG